RAPRGPAAPHLPRRARPEHGEPGHRLLHRGGGRGIPRGASRSGVAVAGQGPGEDRRTLDADHRDGRDRGVRLIMDEEIPTLYYRPGGPCSTRLRLRLTLARVPHRSVWFRDDEEGAAAV